MDEVALTLKETGRRPIEWFDALGLLGPEGGARVLRQEPSQGLDVRRDELFGKDLLLKQRIDGRMMELSAGKNAAQHGVVAAQEGAELILLAVDRLGLIARGP